jgi:hypothetical protein
LGENILNVEPLKITTDFQPAFCLHTKSSGSQAWWHKPIIPVLGRERQKDFKFGGSVGCRNTYLKKPIKG